MRGEVCVCGEGCVEWRVKRSGWGGEGVCGGAECEEGRRGESVFGERCVRRIEWRGQGMCENCQERTVEECEGRVCERARGKGMI